MSAKQQATCHFCGRPTMPWEGEVHQECISQEKARVAAAESGRLSESSEHKRDSHDCPAVHPVHLGNVA
jgi:hypothetical protein